MPRDVTHQSNLLVLLHSTTSHVIEGGAFAAATEGALYFTLACFKAVAVLKDHLGPFN